MKKPPQRVTAGENGLAAMSFVEIGEAMGMSRQTARWYCDSALRKLRRDPEALANLRGLAVELERHRPVAWFGSDEEETA